MKNYISLSLILMAVLLFTLPSVNANLGTYKQNDCINIKTILNSSYANISSLSYPNSTLVLTNVVMTKQGKTFNYSYCLTGAIGTYIYDYFDDSGNVYVNDFSITTNGGTLTTGSGIIYVIAVIIGIALLVLCGYYAIKIPWNHQRNEDNEVIGVNQLKYVKLFLIVACYLILMYMSGALYAITLNYLPEIGISGLFYWVYWILLSLIYPVIICSIIFAFIIWIGNQKFQKALERGLPVE